MRWPETYRSYITLRESDRLTQLEGSAMSEPEYTTVAEQEQVLLPAEVPAAEYPLLPAYEVGGVTVRSDVGPMTPLGRKMLIQASNPGDLEIGKDGTLRVTVYHWLVMPASHTDEDTGEISEYTSVVLFDREGRHYKSASAYAISRLSIMVGLYQREEWDGGIPLVIRERKGRSGRTYHDWRIDMGEQS